MESKKYDPFLDLSLDIPVKFDNVSSSDRNCNITDCLKSFTSVSRSLLKYMYFHSHLFQKPIYI